MKHSPSRSSAQPQIEDQGPTGIKIVKRSHRTEREIVTKMHLERSLCACTSRVIVLHEAGQSSTTRQLPGLNTALIRGDRPTVLKPGGARAAKTICDLF